MWGRMVFIGPTGAEASYGIDGPGAPDLGTVDWLAKAQLCARRSGGRIEVRDATPELTALLDLCGLRRLCGQVLGQPEAGEQPGVQEGVEPGDLVP